MLTRRSRLRPSYVYCRYDDPESCRAKTSLSVELGLAGVGVWIGNALGPFASGNSSVGKAMWASLKAAPAPPPRPPAPPPSPSPSPAQPVFYPPALVSDSPFNDYADGYFLLPRPGGSHLAGVLFGIGAGRFTQSTDLGGR